MDGLGLARDRTVECKGEAFATRRTEVHGIQVAVDRRRPRSRTLERDRSSVLHLLKMNFVDSDHQSVDYVEDRPLRRLHT